METFLSYNENPNDYFKLIASFNSNQKYRSTMRFNNHPVTGDNQIAEAFNRFFCSQFFSHKDDSMSLDFSNSVHNGLEFTLEDFSQVLSKCSPGSGSDNIQGSIIKSAAYSYQFTS